MSGYKNCKWCLGAGCLACDGERLRNEKKKTEKIKNWHPPTKKEIEFARDVASQNEIDPNWIESKLKTPEPILVVEYGDLGKAKEIIGRKNIDKLFKKAGCDQKKFMELFLDEAEQYRIEKGG